MLFRIAEQLGCTVSELSGKLTFSEYIEWCTHIKLKSWEEQGLDLTGPFMPDHPDWGAWQEMKKVTSIG
jgi:hypothetical protein